MFRVLCLALSALLLTTFGHAAPSVLDPVGIYGSIQNAQACLQLAWSLGKTSITSLSTTATVLRLAFHDAGTYQTSTDKGGANGSILNELGLAVSTGLTPAGQAARDALKRVRAGGCPQMTAADMVQILGALGVAMAGGPVCNLLMGRKDFNGQDSTAGLPGPCQNAQSLINSFTSYGFGNPLAATVVLSGSHTLGFARGTCAKGSGALTAKPTVFDNHYYREIVFQTGQKGWLFSDRTLNDASVAPSAMTAMMSQFANNNNAFFSAWCPMYQEMSVLGQDIVSKGGYQVTDGYSPIPSPPPPPPPPQPSAPPPPNTPVAAPNPPPPPSPPPPGTPQQAPQPPNTPTSSPLPPSPPPPSPPPPPPLSPPPPPPPSPPPPAVSPPPPSPPPPTISPPPPSPPPPPPPSPPPPPPPSPRPPPPSPPPPNIVKSTWCTILSWFRVQC